MTIIYVPFDVDMFWTILQFGIIFGIAGILFEIARAQGGINPYGGRLP